MAGGLRTKKIARRLTVGEARVRVCVRVRGISIVIAESEVAVRPVPPSPSSPDLSPRSSSFR